MSVEVLKDLFDHRRIFDARDDLDRATTVLAGLAINLKHPLQTLRLTLIDTWCAGAGSSVVCALRWPRRVVDCNQLIQKRLRGPVTRICACTRGPSTGVLDGQQWRHASRPCDPLRADSLARPPSPPT